MIREALPGDAQAIARLIILAMDDLSVKFTGSSDPDEAIALFERFAAQPGNQYSFENTLVYEDEQGVCGMINAYDGVDLHTLRAPFLDYLNKNYGIKHNPDDETEPGEYYLDCVSVASDRQGQGIGKKLIQAMIDYAQQRKYYITGLLVSKDNPKAEKLYSSLGFKVVKEKDFMGGKYFHMQHQAASE
ncbi:N-acetyltransferase [Pedobacter sp. ASV1-7]|uniref:GNAT family N-acetyltransferase n=1 Tax=Pedobacter sp. ASV1-7 TaxID=3145237 RepID=UPI0032E85B9B